MLPYQGGIEANVGYALQYLKVDFVPQYSLDGGNAIRGGQIIDYVLYIPPIPIALNCQGKHWHTNQTRLEDELKQAAQRRHGFLPMEIWEDDYETVDKARDWLRQNLV
jgi:hypothetical protein